MKPLNADTSSGPVTSSNSVIWQGNDIPCLNLCKGDTISDVTYKLAVEVCDILEVLTLNPTYDLSCLDLKACAPNDFKALIQLILSRICNLETCTGCKPNCEGESHMDLPPEVTSNCCDQLVFMADCFHYDDGIDHIEYNSLIDYVKRIGNIVCSNVDSGNILMSAMSAQATQIAELQAQPAPVFVIPQIIPTCVSAPVPTNIDTVLASLEQQFCQLQDATGNPTALYTGIGMQPAGLENEQALNGSGSTMGSFPGWSSPVQNAADAVGNMWITIMDMRQAIKTIQLNCCPNGCDGIELTLFASINGSTLSIFVNGTIPSGFVECNPLGTTFTITDLFGASITITFSITTYLNNPTGYHIDLSGTPINVTSDLSIDSNPCLVDHSTNTTCERCLGYTMINNASCPEVVLSTTESTVTFNFTTTAGLKSYSVELWTADGATMLSNQIFTYDTVQFVTGTFTGLAPNTTYRVRITITVSGCQGNTQCPYITATTSPLSCPPPEDVVAEINENQ